MQLSNEEAQGLMALTSAYARLNLRQTMEQVKAILGPPTSVRRLFSKSQRTGSIGTSFEYKVTAHHSAVPNTNDILISVVFDKDGLLIGVQPQNIPSLRGFHK
jgi:hypothetical protein